MNISELTPDLQDAVAALTAKLKLADKAIIIAEKIKHYAPLETVECRGDKCREAWCISCFGEESADAGLAVVRENVDGFNAALAAYREATS